VTLAVVRRHRRPGAALLVAGLVCAMAGAFLWRFGPPAHAEASLSSFGLHSGARGWRFFDEDATNGNQEAEVPESSANLANGPVGYGLASVVWPGPLASNAGSLILVLQPTAPPQATVLNNPIRAEARTGQNPPTTTNNNTPGTSMVATAKGDLVEALATVSSSSGGGSFGPSHTHAVTNLARSSAKAASDSLVQNVSLAGGVVKIDSVSSVAEATTDGTKSGGDAHTTVHGMTIGGQPATIDDKGLHIGSQDQPANAAANQIAQQALGKSGTSITLSKPDKETKDATTSVTAGSLVVSWNTGSGSIFSVTLGGAEATVTAAPGIDLGLPGVAMSGGVDTGSGLPGATGAGAAPLSAGVPTAGSAGSASPTAPTGTGATAGRTATPSLQLAAHGRLITTAAVVLAVLATVLVGFGMRRLGDSILAEPAAAVCPLAEDSS
jgi:hypothetical protein